MGAINVADILTMQDLANGHLDVKALGEAANGDENTIVTTRTGNTYPSAERAINIMFENGGLPATPFATKALMTASALVDGDYAMVTDDPANNGLYVKTAGAWVKSEYDPLAQAKVYADNKVKGVTNNFKTKALMTASTLPDDSYAMVTEDVEANNGLYVKAAGAWVKSNYDPVVNANEYTDSALNDFIVRERNASFIEHSSVNIFNKNDAISGFLRNTNGEITESTTASVSDYMPTTGDEVFSQMQGGQVAFYDENKDFISGIGSGTPAFTFSTPQNARYFRVGVQNTALETYMVIRGDVRPTAGDFVTYDKWALSSNVSVDVSEQVNDAIPLAEIKASQVDFLTRNSRNLFDKSKAVRNRTVHYLDGTLLPSTDRSASDWIPVDGGAVYTQKEGSAYAIYDSEKNYLYGEGFGGSARKITTPQNAAYIRVTVRDIRFDNYIVVKGDEDSIYADTIIPFDNFLLNSNIDLMPEKVINATEDIILDLLDRKSKWTGKKWAVIGDSIAHSPLSYWRKIAEKKGINAAHYGVSGSAIAVRDAPWDTNAICVHYKNMPDDADLITVTGGTNDIFQVPLGEWDVLDNRTGYGSMRILCEGLVEKYPTKHICFILPLTRGRGAHTSLTPEFVNYRKMQIEVLEYYAIPYFDSSVRLPIRFYNPVNSFAYSVTTSDEVTGDGLHPNDAGHQLIADAVTKWIETL